jgi:hypothetical protein
MADTLTTPFTKRTRSIDWTAFLTRLQQDYNNTELTVYLHPVSYKDLKQKNSYINAMVKGTPMHEDWNNCHTAGSAAHQYRAGSGTLYVFIVNMDPAAPGTRNGPLEKPAVEQEHQNSEPESYWHAMVVHVQNRIMGIYDPSYVNNSECSQEARLSSLTSMNFIRCFIKDALKKKIDRVYVGGGGNTSGIQCNEMCRQWLIGEFITGNCGGRNLGNWEARGWREYKPN